MAEGRYIEAAGLRTHYIDEGKGPLLVLVHGAGLAVDSELTWWRQIEDLSRDHRVVAFDQIGFGRTDLPPDRLYQSRLQRVPHAIAVLRALGLKDATLVGHSEGGFIALRIAHQHPELARRLVIVTSGSAAPMLGGSLDDAWIAASDAAYNYDSAMLTVDAFVARKRNEYRALDQRTARLYRENFDRAQREGQIDLTKTMPFAETDMRAYMDLQAAHIAPILGDIRQPVMMIWAGDDATVPVARGVAMREKFRAGADLHILAGAQHMVMHDRAEAFNNLIRSWRA
jgi:pimeloyl-ACP methyl ester carboxylesterase